MTMVLNALVTEKCWMTTASNMATADESSITGMVGFFHADPIKIIRRGMSSMTTFQVKACESVLFIFATLSKLRPPVDWTPRPATNMTIATTNKEGKVVHSRCFICVNTFTWVMAAAKLVSPDKRTTCPRNRHR